MPKNHNLIKLLSMLSPNEELLESIVRNILKERGELSSLNDLLPQQVNSVSRDRPVRDISQLEIIRPRDLPLVTGLSRTSCWRLSKDPTSGWPPKIRLSAGAVGYSRKLIELFLKSREVGNNG